MEAFGVIGNPGTSGITTQPLIENMSFVYTTHTNSLTSLAKAFVAKSSYRLPMVQPPQRLQ